MITSIEAINMLYAHLGTSVLKTDSKKPNGKLCKYQRSENSISEDVVLNALGLNREPVQKGVLLLNCYVPNLDPNKVPDIGTDKSQPDTGRLLYISKLVQSVFGNEGTEETELWINDNTNFSITSDDVFEDNNFQHYISFRIDFFTIK